MNLLNSLATFGVNTKARPTSANVAGQISIGRDQENVRLTGADVAYSWEALIVGATAQAVVDIESNTEDDITGFDWVAGTAQVETATAAGTVTGAGTVIATITAAGLTGSPLAVSFTVANGDTAAVWAEKARVALTANAAVSALFVVDGASTAIRLTRKPTASFTVGNQTIGVFPANDGTLNIALDNGTATGTTPEATSANTTAGVATSGVYAPDANGKDFEGNEIATGWDIQALHAKVIAGEAEVTAPVGGIDQLPLEDGGQIAIQKEVAVSGDVTFEAVSATALVSFTVIGKTA
jgi:hypothetical protein